MSPTAALRWNVNYRHQKIFLYETALYIIGMSTEKVSDPRFSQIAAHEIGHCLGLWDAYPDANFFANNEISPKKLDPNVEVGDNSIMWYGTMATSNDIEMVLQAFVKNEQQYYYASIPYPKSKVIRCPQTFIE